MYDYREISDEEAEKLSMEEQSRMVNGFEFILRRAKEIASYHETTHDGRNFGKTFNEDRYEIRFHDDHLQIIWTWTETGSYQYREEHEDFVNIPFTSIFSKTEEEKRKAEIRDRQEQEAAERRRRDEQERKRREEAAKARALEDEKKKLRELLDKHGLPANYGV